MRPILVGLFVAVTLGAQTEVRRAIVLPSYKDLKYPPLPPIKPPVPTEFTLSNGMKVFLLEDHELPLVQRNRADPHRKSIRPAGKIGLAGITGDVLRAGGTRQRPAIRSTWSWRISRPRWKAASAKHPASLSFSCLKENTGQVLGVFKDLLTSARVPPGQAGSRQDATAQQYFPPQRRRARHRRARVRQHPLRPQHSLRLEDGVQRRRRHPAAGSGEFLSPLLFPGQHHAGNLRRLSRQPR